MRWATPPTVGIDADITAVLGFRPRGLFASDGPPRAIALTNERDATRPVYNGECEQRLTFSLRTSRLMLSFATPSWALTAWTQL